MQKQNVFDDFIAAAESLLKKKISYRKNQHYRVVQTGL
jgi:prolyl oligopeptidase PreP (S9A serine peptidase family)